jgi:hypothetical protein
MLYVAMMSWIHLFFVLLVTLTMIWSFDMKMTDMHTNYQKMNKSSSRTSMKPGSKRSCTHTTLMQNTSNLDLELKLHRGLCI